MGIIKPSCHNTTSQMIQLYCDRLSFAVFIRALWLKIWGRNETISASIIVLDAQPVDRKDTLLGRLVAALGFAVKEAEFFTGHLKTASGQPVYLAARRHAGEISLVVAKAMLSRSRLLTKLNVKWDRDTVCLYLANQLWSLLEFLFIRIFVAQALARRSHVKAHLILRCPLLIQPRLFNNPAPEIQVSYDKDRLGLGLLGGGGGREAVGLFLSRVRRLFKPRIGHTASLPSNSSSAQQAMEGATDQDASGLLMVQEDEISLDRSYRTQPHWYLSEQAPRLAFDTYILAQAHLPAPDAETKAQLQAHRIRVVQGSTEALRAALSGKLHPVRRQLLKDVLRCLMAALVSLSMASKLLTLTVARFLWRAQNLVELLQRLRISTLLVSENYLLDVQGMLLVAPTLKIRTLAFQYNNPFSIFPSLLNTADIMLTFSPLYHQYWLPVDGPRPKAFLDTGYVFDTSFAYVRDRARTRRSQLEQQNVRFVIGYLDESVQIGKYGLISREDHCTELRALFEYVLDHPDVGLLVKSQFVQNAPQHFPEIRDIQSEVSKTGRYLELTHGIHRNICFPAEMAFSADLVIGHAVGATAALEAALTKTRCVLLNPYGMVTNKDLYPKADIIYPSVLKVLEAVDDFRSGDSGRAALGDWTRILDSFDSFQDGQAGHRLRKILEGVVVRGESETTLGYHTSAS